MDHFPLLSIPSLKHLLGEAWTLCRLDRLRKLYLYIKKIGLLEGEHPIVPQGTFQQERLRQKKQGIQP